MQDANLNLQLPVNHRCHVVAIAFVASHTTGIDLPETAVIRAHPVVEALEARRERGSPAESSGVTLPFYGLLSTVRLVVGG